MSKRCDSDTMVEINDVLFDLSILTKFGAIYETHISKYDKVNWLSDLVIFSEEYFELF